MNLDHLPAKDEALPEFCPSCGARAECLPPLRWGEHYKCGATLMRDEMTMKVVFGTPCPHYKEPAKDGWIPWSGKDTTPPVHPDTIVEVAFRRGNNKTGRAGSWHACWRDDSDRDDIVAYRVVTPAKEPWSLDRHIAQYFRPLQPGEKWHREDDWTEEHLPAGWRPLLRDEKAECGDEWDSFGGGREWRHQDATAGPYNGATYVRHRTRRPLPPLPAKEPDPLTPEGQIKPEVQREILEASEQPYIPQPGDRYRVWMGVGAAWPDGWGSVAHIAFDNCGYDKRVAEGERFLKVEDPPATKLTPELIAIIDTDYDSPTTEPKPENTTTPMNIAQSTTPKVGQIWTHGTGSCTETGRVLAIDGDIIIVRKLGWFNSDQSYPMKDWRERSPILRKDVSSQRSGSFLGKTVRFTWKAIKGTAITSAVIVALVPNSVKAAAMAYLAAKMGW